MSRIFESLKKEKDKRHELVLSKKTCGESCNFKRELQTTKKQKYFFLLYKITN
jgi:hypothetical protein